MSNTIHLSPTDFLSARPFTHPSHVDKDRLILGYMVNQVCLLLEYRYFTTAPPHKIHFSRPDNSDWFHRIVIARPDELQTIQPLIVVGFFGQRRQDADLELNREFDRILVAEIPEHTGLLSYSTMALADGNYGNLVLFADHAARDHWSTSQAHAQAVEKLAPNYYRTVYIYNGYLPHGIQEPGNLQLVRVKYYDYLADPIWRAVREIMTTTSDDEINGYSINE